MDTIGLRLLLVVALAVPSQTHNIPSQSPIQRAHDALLGMFKYYYRSVCQCLFDLFVFVFFQIATLTNLSNAVMVAL